MAASGYEYDSALDIWISSWRRPVNSGNHANVLVGGRSRPSLAAAHRTNLGSTLHRQSELVAVVADSVCASFGSYESY